MLRFLISLILVSFISSQILPQAALAQEDGSENLSQKIINKFKLLTKGKEGSDLDRFIDPKEEEMNNYRITLDKVNSERFMNFAVLRGLNKITATTSILKTKVGQKIDFGKLEIIVHKCWQSPITEKPDSKILLEIFENKVSGEKVRIFYGWMIASSPSVSGIEHPIYDITALNCKNEQN